MLKYHRTSILTSQAQTIVNTVNTVGVMGKGLASVFKSKYPEMFKTYRALCKEGRLEIGQLWLWKSRDQWILNFPTKRHWRNPSKLSYVEAGLKKFVDQYDQRGIREVAFPRLGCGNGGLDWRDVRPLMEQYLSPLPIPVYIHDFEVKLGLPEHKDALEQDKFHRSFETFIRDLSSVLHRERGSFVTISNNSEYQASFDEMRNLVIARGGRNKVVSEEELYELWTLLLSAPLTRQRLPGTARDEAYYLFPILAQLPYVRAVELGRKNDTSAMAVELMNQSSNTTILGEENGVASQGELKWG